MFAYGQSLDKLPTNFCNRTQNLLFCPLIFGEPNTFLVPPSCKTPPDRLKAVLSWALLGVNCPSWGNSHRKTALYCINLPKLCLGHSFGHSSDTGLVSRLDFQSNSHYLTLRATCLPCELPIGLHGICHFMCCAHCLCSQTQESGIEISWVFLHRHV